MGKDGMWLLYALGAWWLYRSMAKEPDALDDARKKYRETGEMTTISTYRGPGQENSDG